MNEGTLDRSLRTILGIAVVSLVFVGPRSLWALVGLLPLATGLVGFCPVYRLAGIDTRRVPSRKAGAKVA